MGKIGPAPKWPICKICGRDYRLSHESKFSHLISHGIKIVYGGRRAYESYYLTYFTKESDS